MIHRRILTILLVGLSGVIFTAPAGAAKAPHRYSPHHGSKCRVGYKRVVKHKRHHRTKVFCVKRAMKKKAAPTPPAASAPNAATSEKPKLHSHLDPTFTRDPLNPFKVTYAYSASASQEASPQLRAMGVMEEPAPLPSGVLSLFSDGKLECAINVGGNATEGECPVTYQALGQHTVTTIYASGEQSATETETEQIDPLPTTTSLTLSYEDLQHPIELKSQGSCKTFGGIEPRCEYEYEWLLGTLTAEGISTPIGPERLSCVSGIRCQSEFGSKTLSGTLTAPVTLRATAFTRFPAAEHPDCEELKAIIANPAAEETEWSYPTDLGLVASVSASGYATSSSPASIEFQPTLPC